MTNIKIRNISKKTIKTLDKAKTWTERIKNPIIYLNEKSKASMENDSSIVDYGDNQVKFISNRMRDETINQIIKRTPKTTKKIINSEKKVIKVADKSIKSTAKTVKKTTKASRRVIEQGRKLAIETTKATVKSAKALIKVTTSSIKAIIASTKALLSAIIAGGWIAVIIIIVICLIALICGSCFGIFFSNEGSSKTMSDVISELKIDLYHEIEKQKILQQYDDYDIDATTNNWREVIAIYSVKYEGSEVSEPILYLNEDNISKLKKVFWDMNTITSIIVNEEWESETLSNGNYITTLQPKKVLHITVNTKSKDSLMEEYHFTSNQKKQVNELLDSKYNSLWNNLLYGTINNDVIVNIAIQEVGNVHGEKYWKWYGFNDRVAWCAIFVSWVANQAEILDSSIPRFSVVGNGARWFKERGQWEGPDYVPKSGDLIFFDWEQDKKLNHVGIVEKVENNYIYVIEGNSNDQCKENKYSINDKVIVGFGVTMKN